MDLMGDLLNSVLTRGAEVADTALSLAGEAAESNISAALSGNPASGQPTATNQGATPNQTPALPVSAVKPTDPNTGGIFTTKNIMIGAGVIAFGLVVYLMVKK